MQKMSGKKQKNLEVRNGNSIVRYEGTCLIGERFTILITITEEIMRKK